VSIGEWVLQQKQLDLAGVHAALLPNGKILFFSYFPPEEDNVNLSKWQLWQEDQGPLSPAGMHLGRNLFCSGHCFLPDGRLLVAAGQSWNSPFSQGIWGADHDIHTFDPTSERWSRHQDMPAARYYPTCVTLPNGIALICGGAWTRVWNQANHESETFDWRSNIKSPPARFDPGHISELYPFLQVLPDGSPTGKLFVFSKNEARLFDLGSRTWGSNSFKTTSPGSRNYPHQGSCLLLPLLPEKPQQVRVMVIGGQGHDDEATNTVEIFEFDRTNPANSRWRAPAGGHMAQKRFMSDAVLLPDQTVLVVNGAGAGAADHSHHPVRETQLFDTGTETWKPLAPINRDRMYHSTAILLPSGRVLVAGNTEHWNPSNPVEDKTVEIFTPPYLQRGSRPRIAEAPSQLAYGQQFGIRSPDAGRIRSVALMRAGSVTHTNNMDQRYVGLAIVGRSADRLTVRAPQDGTYAPLGHYLLFIVNDDRVPSVASMVRLNQIVRYRNIIKMRHLLTTNTLHSHALNYGHPGTSGQQQVTAFAGSDDNDLWRVKGPDGQPANFKEGEPVQHGDTIRLEHVLTGRNLHSHGGFPSPVTSQQEVTCYGDNGIGDANDNWRIEIEGGGTWDSGKRLKLIHVLTNHALHSHSGFSHPQWTAGQQEVTGFSGRDDNDLWCLFEGGMLGAPIRAKHSGKVLDVAGISTANGAQLQQWDYLGGNNQKWRFEAVGGDYHRIVAQHSGKVLDVVGRSTANGARLQQWDYLGGDNQKWRLEPLDDGSYRIVAKHSGKVLDVVGVSTANGAQIQQYDWVGGNNQRWKL
jgi:hypothetical protein